ncbi:M48 family metalloprotease [Streptomyces sp. NPDC005917]
MLRLLNGQERGALLAHERAHLRHRHHVFSLVLHLTAAVNPLLRPLERAGAFAVERRPGLRNRPQSTAKGPRSPRLAPPRRRAGGRLPSSRRMRASGGRDDLTAAAVAAAAHPGWSTISVGLPQQRAAHRRSPADGPRPSPAPGRTVLPARRSRSGGRCATYLKTCRSGGECARRWRWGSVGPSAWRGYRAGCAAAGSALSSGRSAPRFRDATSGVAQRCRARLVK